MLDRTGLIDVWDVTTFDPELVAELQKNRDLIHQYRETERQQLQARDASDKRMPYPENPYAAAYLELKEYLAGIMISRTIRAWHYSRMVEAEIASIKRDGLYLATMESFRARLDARVEAGDFDRSVANQLFADSPFQSQQFDGRTGKLWAVSHPAPSSSGAVDRLLGSWGGEASYFWQGDLALQSLLRTLGKPTILEVAMPLAFTNRSFRAAEAVIGAFAATLGSPASKEVFDLYSVAPLGAERILAIHTEKDAVFSSVGRGYPTGYLALED